MEFSSEEKGTTAQEQNIAVETGTIGSEIGNNNNYRGESTSGKAAGGTDSNVDSQDQIDFKADVERTSSRNDQGNLTLDDVETEVDDISGRVGQLDIEEDNRTHSRSKSRVGDIPSIHEPNNRDENPERLSNTELDLITPRPEENNQPEEEEEVGGREGEAGGGDFLNVQEPGRTSVALSAKSRVSSSVSRKGVVSRTENEKPESLVTQDNERPETLDTRDNENNDQTSELVGFGHDTETDTQFRSIPNSPTSGEKEEPEKGEDEEEDRKEKEGAMDEDNLGTFTVDQQTMDTARLDDEEEDSNELEKGTLEEETEQEKDAEQEKDTEQEKSSGYIASREPTELAKGNNSEINSQSDKSREVTQVTSKPPIKRASGVRKDNPRRKTFNANNSRQGIRTGTVVKSSFPQQQHQPQPPQQFDQGFAANADDTAGSNAMDSETEADLSLQGAIRPRRKEQQNAYKSKAVKEKYAVSSNGSRLPLALSDDDLNSSESDAMPTVRDEERYEESKLRELSNNNRRSENYVMEDPNDPATLKKGKRVYFFRNGDIHYKPKQVLISSKTYQNFEKLLVDLSAIVETSTGVKFIFAWPDGREIKSMTQFENGKYYVCSSINRLQRVDYGNSKENPWKGGKVERHEHRLFQKDGKVQSPLRKPRVLTIISNMYRDSREKLILNTSSAMNFEEILHDISNMVNIPNPPVRALFTERKPHLQVFSYSQLIRDFADHDNFLACGEEMIPLEMSPNKRPYNGFSLSSDGSKKGPKRTPRYVSHGIDNDYGSPTRSSVLTAYQPVSEVTPRQPKGEVRVRRRKTDSIRVDINGKTREFFPPTMMEENEDGAKPDKKLRLDWVYGFRGRDVKQNLAVLPSSGELVYFVAAVVVLYDKRFSTQKHYLGHSEEITCLTVHPNGRFVASGQTAGKTPESGAHIRIWDGMSLSTYAVIGLGVFQQGIACLNFSEKEAKILTGMETVTGDLLMAIDDSDRHVMSVWEWQTEKLVARTTLVPFIMKTSSDPVVSGCFYPFDDTLLITYGKEHIHFWRMFWEKGRKVMRDKLSGNFEDDVPKFVTSVCFSPSGDVITGDSNGTILIWTRDNSNVFAINDHISIQTRRAHKKSVAALCMLGDGTLFSGGGSEIKAWDTINNYSLVKERVLPESAGHVRSIVPINIGGLDGSIYVSTTRNKVLEGSLQLKFKFVIQSHVEELWALESHPLEQTFVSAGHDQTVIKWSAVSHAPVWKVDVEKPCTSISIDPRGRMIALGTTGGKVIVLNSYNGIQLTALLTGTAQINAMSFSPDARQLAVGTFDGTILIFFVQEEGHSFFKAQTAALRHNNMFIMHIDWSMDSKFIQAVLGDYDIIYWDVTNMQRIKTARSLRDVKWATLNCPIGHSVIGPWQNLDRGDVINVVSRSQYRDFLAAGDSRGRVRLYKWPCSVPKAGHRNTKVYSSNVTCVTFTCDDGYLLTSGGNDAALMQFSILDPNNTR